MLTKKISGSQQLVPWWNADGSFTADDDTCRANELKTFFIRAYTFNKDPLNNYVHPAVKAHSIS